MTKIDDLLEELTETVGDRTVSLTIPHLPRGTYTKDTFSGWLSGQPSRLVATYAMKIDTRRQ